MRLLFILSLIPAICFSQALTDLKTKEQAASFIKDNFKYHDYKYDQFVIDPVDSSFDNFKEGDFNHDGIKDLLVFGTAQVTAKKTTYKEDEIVILIGDKNPRKVNFPYGFFSVLGIHIPYPKVISIKNQDYVLIKYDVTDYRKRTTQTFHDTLFVKEDHVIPFTKNPSKNIVTKIEFKTSPCYGTCPVYELSIDEHLNVLYNGIEYVDRKGEYKLKADKKDWDYLIDLIRNLKIENLTNNYSIDWTDHPTGYLTVYFKNGEIKKIEDYGLKGTFGLSLVYDYFSELKRF